MEFGVFDPPFITNDPGGQPCAGLSPCVLPSFLCVGRTSLTKRPIFLGDCSRRDLIDLPRRHARKRKALGIKRKFELNSTSERTTLDNVQKSGVNSPAIWGISVGWTPMKSTRFYTSIQFRVGKLGFLLHWNQWADYRKMSWSQVLVEGGKKKGTKSG